MAKLKLKQILSNLSYNSSTDQLILSGSGDPTFIISGSAIINNSQTVSGSLTINGYDTFGDKDSPDTIDLGTY